MKNKFTTPEIERLRARKLYLTERVQALDEEIHTKELALCPVKLGELVRHGGAVYKVSGITLLMDTWWLAGHKQLKDGGFHKRVHHLFEQWEKIK